MSAFSQLANAWDMWSQSPIAVRLSSALLHFLWQGAALSAGASLLLSMLKRRSPQVRYGVLLSTLGAMAASPVVTFALLPVEVHERITQERQPAVAAATFPTTAAPAFPVELPKGTAVIAPRESRHPSSPSDRVRQAERLNLDVAADSARAPAPAGDRMVEVGRWFEAHRPWIVAAWLVGVCVFSLRALAGLVGAEWTRRRGVVSASEPLQRVVTELVARLGIRRTVRVARSALADVPLLVGWLSPVILLPASALSGLTPAQLEAILVHELAHVRRHDYLFNMAQTLVETFLFYHPAVWWISDRIRQEREHCCDDVAVAVCGDRIAYARALATLEELRGSSPRWAMAATGASLVVRIRRLLHPERNPTAGWGAAVCFGFLAATLAVLYQSGRTAEQSNSPPVLVNAASKPGMPGGTKVLPAKEEVGDVLVVRGQVVTPDGKPAAGAEVLVLRYYIRRQPGRGPIATTRTDSSGRFELPFRKSQFEDAAGERWSFAKIAAKAKGFGMQWTDWDETEPLLLKLVPDLPIRGRLVNLEGQPVVGARVAVSRMGIQSPAEGNLDSWIATIKSGDPEGPRMRVLGRLLVGGYAGAFDPVSTTDADGRFLIAGIGAERMVTLEFQGDTIAYSKAEVATRTMAPIQSVSFNGKKDQIYGAEFTFAAPPTQPLEGTIRDAATGKPLAGVMIESYYFLASYDREDVLRAKSDSNGRYRLLGMPKGKGNVFFIVPNHDQPYLMRQIEVPETAGFGPVTVDVELHRGLWISGRITDKATGKPVVAAYVQYLPNLTNPYTFQLPEFDRSNGDGRMEGDQSFRFTPGPDGRYRLPGLPGGGIVAVNAPGGKYLMGIGAPEIHGMLKNGVFPTYRAPFVRLAAGDVNALKEIDPAAGAQNVTCDFDLVPGESSLHVVVDPGGRPVRGCTILGLAPGNMGSMTNRDSTVEVVGLAPTETRQILIVHPRFNLGKYFELKPADRKAGEMTVRLEPCAKLIGRFVDEEGTGLKGITVNTYVTNFPGAYFSLPAPASAADGKFSYPYLVAGGECTFLASSPNRGTLRTIEKIIGAAGTTIDLGDIKLGRRR